MTIRFKLFAKTARKFILFEASFQRFYRRIFLELKDRAGHDNRQVDSFGSILNRDKERKENRVYEERDQKLFALLILGTLYATIFLIACILTHWKVFNL